MKHGYVIIIATVDGQHDVTRLVQLLNFFHLWTATQQRERLAVARGEYSRHVQFTEAWPVVRDAHASVSLPYFRPMFVSQKAVTPGRACTTATAY